MIELLLTALIISVLILLYRHDAKKRRLFTYLKIVYVDDHPVHSKIVTSAVRQNNFYEYSLQKEMPLRMYGTTVITQDGKMVVSYILMREEIL